MSRITAVLAILGALAAPAAADVSKEDIKKLAAAGVSDDVILTYVRTHGPAPRLSADDLVELKNAGVSDRVLAVLACGTGPAQPDPAQVAVSAERTVYVPATTVVYEPPTVYYWGARYHYPYVYDYYAWPTWYYSRCYHRYPTVTYCYPRHYTLGASVVISGHRTTRTSPPRSYSSLRVGSRAGW